VLTSPNSCSLVRNEVLLVDVLALETENVFIPLVFEVKEFTTKDHCVFCHTGAIHAEHAGIPPVETCMLCHKRIIVTHPEIKKLKDYFDSGTPVPWERVNRLSEFAFFNHQRHVRAGFDCGAASAAINVSRVKGFCTTAATSRPAHRSPMSRWS